MPAQPFPENGFLKLHFFFLFVVQTTIVPSFKIQTPEKMKKKEPRTQMLLLQNKTAWHRRWHPAASPYLFPWTYQGKLRDGYFYIFGSLVRDCLLSRFLLAVFICTGFHTLEILENHSNFHKSRDASFRFKFFAMGITITESQTQLLVFFLCYHFASCFNAKAQARLPLN